jgi:N-acetylmuramoyl-L-alanine amidase
MVPRAAPAAARLAVSACSRLFPRKTTVGALEPATALRRIDPRVGAAARWPGSPMHTSSRKGKAMACRIAISFAVVAMGISPIATHASATCKFKAKKDIIVILDVGHTDKDSGQISARGVKEYDFNMNLARRLLEELVNTGFISTQMIVTSGSNTHESRLQRSKRANDLGADLFISVHHDGVKNETLMPWQYNGKTHWFLDKFEGFSLWVSQKNNKYEESLSFAKTLADQLMASGLKFTTHHDELTNTAKYGRIAPLVDRERGIYDASDHIAVLYESHMPAVLVEAGMIVNRAEEQALSSATGRAIVARAVGTAVERFCAVGAPQT